MKLTYSTSKLDYNSFAMHPSIFKKFAILLVVAIVAIASLQLDIAEAKEKSDLLFVKGKFIKKDKKGVIVVDEKSHCGCHGKRK